MPEIPMMTEAQRDEPKTLCATADVSDRSWYQARTRTLILRRLLLIPIPCPRSKTVLASSQVDALTLLRQRLSRP
jgi:hypothetical protein